MPTEILIESGNRWDTLALLGRLPRCRWYLVQQSPSHWDLHVEAPSSSKLLAEIVEAAMRWATVRQLDSVVHLPSPELPLLARRARPDDSRRSRLLAARA